MVGDRPLVLLSAVMLLVSAAAAGCGGGGAPAPSPPPPPPPAPAPDFSLALSPSSLNLTQGATSAPVTLTITGSNGFSSPVQITLSGLPGGVTSNPSTPFTLTPGSTQAIVFAASSTVATGNFSVSVQGASGSLNHSAALSMAVQAALPSRTGYVRLDLGPAGNSGATQHRQVVYDSSRKRVFVANPPGNLVAVLSGSDRKIIARISAPHPVSMDISPDGTKIWVGTAVEQIVSIDAASLEANGRFALAGLPGPLNTLFSIPQDVVALPSGKLLVSLGRAGAPGTRLALWDPATNTLVDLTSQASLALQNGPGAMARTGDFKQVLVAANDASGNLVLLDAATGTVIHSALFAGFLPALVAANGDGSHFAVFLAGQGVSQIVLLDAFLNVVTLRQADAVHGLVFSRDARSLYISENLDLPPVITVAGAVNLQTLGQVADVRVAGVRTQIQDVDETSLLMGTGNRGVSFLDASKPGSLSVTAPVLTSLPSVTPSSGPATGGTSVVLAGQNYESSAQVAFGSQAASGATVTGGTSIQATSPPAVSPGPVNVTAFFPSGWVALAPDAFSYGPQILQLLTTAGRPEGGNLVQVLGYGFGADPSQITATLGGKTAAVQTVEDAPAVVQSLGLTAQFPFPLQRLTLVAPSGTPGKADLTISSPAGSATSPAAYQYLQSVRMFAQPGSYKFIFYDRTRQRIFLSNVDSIAIFDPKASQFIAPLSLPGGPPPATQLRWLALSPDGALLAVADFGGQSVYLLNPDVPGSGSRVSVGGVAGFLNSGPARIAVTSAGKAFVALAASGATNGCSQCLGQLDLTTKTLQAAPQPEVSTLTGSPIVQDAETGQRVFLVFGGAPGGPVAVWNASTDRFETEPGSVSATDLAAAGDGTLLVTAAGSPANAAVLTARNSDLKLVGAAAYQETQLFPGYTPVPSLAVHPSGGLLYRPFLTGAPGSAAVQGGVDILNARSGALKMRLILPEPLQTDVDALHGSFLTIDEDGKRIFAITSSGLTVVELARVPLSIGSVQPAQGPAAGGTALTIRGSSFQSGVQVALGGAAAAVTLVDVNTLRVTSPALSPGPKRITITNPDGETESLDAGFTAN